MPIISPLGPCSSPFSELELLVIFLEPPQREVGAQLTSTMHGSETHTALRLCAREALSIRDKDLLPPLYSPLLVALGSSSLLLRGFQSEDGTAYVQEWRCVLDS